MKKAQVSMSDSLKAQVSMSDSFLVFLSLSVSNPGWKWFIIWSG
jgi:hypothetical protein